MIYLQPGGVLRLAGMMPSAQAIGWAIVLTGAAVFALRLSAWRRGLRIGCGSTVPGSAREG